MTMTMVKTTKEDFPEPCRGRDLVGPWWPMAMTTTKSPRSSPSLSRNFPCPSCGGGRSMWLAPRSIVIERDRDRGAGSATHCHPSSRHAGRGSSSRPSRDAPPIASISTHGGRGVRPVCWPWGWDWREISSTSMTLRRNMPPRHNNRLYTISASLGGLGPKFPLSCCRC